MSETPRQYYDEDDNPRVRNLEDCAGYSHDQAEKMAGVDQAEQQPAGLPERYSYGSTRSPQSRRSRAAIGPQYADGARAELGIDEVPQYEPLSEQQQVTNRRGREAVERALELNRQHLIEKRRAQALQDGSNPDAAERAYLERQRRPH